MKKRIQIDIDLQVYTHLQMIAVNTNNKVKPMIENMLNRFVALASDGQIVPEVKPLARRVRKAGTVIVGNRAVSRREGKRLMDKREMEAMFTPPAPLPIVTLPPPVINTGVGPVAETVFKPSTEE